MRKKRGFYNALGSLITYVVAMGFVFATQTMVVKILGIEYSGINGLFTNILNMLSIAELGLGTTIIYKLYEPIAHNNVEEIKSWLNFYKICYRFVALFILIAGLLVIPLVPIIVGKVAFHDNIIILYLISLSDIVLSYTMNYKRSLLYADQKNYILNIIHILYTVFLNLTQILVLYLTKNYAIFLTVKVIYRVLENVIINIFVNRNYSYVREKSSKISTDERKDFFKRILAMVIQRISFVVNKGIDNILISVFLGIVMVGYYTNYNLIATTICTVIYQAISGLTASVGDLLTEKNKSKNYDVYLKINLVNVFFTGICIVGFLNCIQPFMKLWLGSEYLLDFSIIICFGIYIYADSSRRAITIFKEAAGICREDQYMYIFMSVINLISSIILCKFFGVFGVVMGTSISLLFLILYSYPKYIFQPLFDKKIINYYILIFKYICIITISSIISCLICNLLVINNILFKFLLNGLLSIFIFLIIFILFSFKSKEFKYYKSLFFNKICFKK